MNIMSCTHNTCMHMPALLHWQYMHVFTCLVRSPPVQKTLLEAERSSREQEVPMACHGTIVSIWALTTVTACRSWASCIWT